MAARGDAAYAPGLNASPGLTHGDQSQAQLGWGSPLEGLSWMYLRRARTRLPPALSPETAMFFAGMCRVEVR